MADCKLLSGCLFFNDKMANKPGTAEMLKKKYFKGDSSDCARFMVFEALGRPKVPTDLFPSQTDRAREIIAVG